MLRAVVVDDREIGHVPLVAVQPRDRDLARLLGGEGFFDSSFHEVDAAGRIAGLLEILLDVVRPADHTHAGVLPFGVQLTEGHLDIAD